MNDWLIALFIGAAVGLVIGIKIARDSNKKLAVTGGPLAQLFHYLASAALTGTMPYVITGLIVGLSFLKLFGTAVGFLAVAALSLLIYGIFERASTASTVK